MLIEPMPTAPAMPARMQFRHVPDYESEELPVLDWGYDVQERQLQWLWPGRIPLGKITLLAGDPEAGKSFLVCDLAARTTRGGPWPDGVEPDGPEVESEPGSDATGSVLFITAEDNVEDTFLPRLRAAGADIRRCTFLRGVAEAGKPTKPFDFESQWQNFEIAIARTIGCKLVVIDPMFSFLGNIAPNSQVKLRKLLTKIADLAARRGVAVVMTVPLNKRTCAPAVHRVMGSSEFMAAARAAWMIERVPDDADSPAGAPQRWLNDEIDDDQENSSRKTAADSTASPSTALNPGMRRILVPMKNNLAGQRSALAFTITADDPLAVAKLKWDHQPTPIPDPALPRPRFNLAEQKYRDDQAYAERWLAERLHFGYEFSNTIEKDWKGAADVLDRAAQRLGVVKRRFDWGRKPISWFLPKHIERETEKMRQSLRDEAQAKADEAAQANAEETAGAAADEADQPPPPARPDASPPAACDPPSHSHSHSQSDSQNDNDGDNDDDWDWVDEDDPEGEDPFDDLDGDQDHDLSATAG